MREGPRDATTYSCEGCCYYAKPRVVTGLEYGAKCTWQRVVGMGVMQDLPDAPVTPDWCAALGGDDGEPAEVDGYDDDWMRRCRGNRTGVVWLCPHQECADRCNWLESQRVDKGK